jgi:PAS domain S-box-containing protein
MHQRMPTQATPVLATVDLAALATSDRGDEAAVAIPLEGLEVLLQSTAGARVLVVDGDAAIRAYLSRLFERAGWRVEAAPGDAAAFERVKATAPDLVLLGVGARTVGPPALLQDLRAQAAVSQIPVILFSARAPGPGGSDGSLPIPMTGASDYICKLSSARELVVRVGAQLGLARTRCRALDADAFLVQFSDAVRGVEDHRVVARTACRMLVERLGTEEAHWTEIDWATREYVLKDAFRVADPAGFLLESGRFPLDQWEPFTSSLLAGRSIVVRDALVDPDLPVSTRKAVAAFGIRAELAVPVLVGGKLRAVLAVMQRTPRQWALGEIALVNGIAGRCWAEIERGSAERALQESEAHLSAVFEALPVGVGVLDPTGRTILSNAEWRRFLPNTTIPSRDPKRGSRWRLMHPDGRLATPDEYPGARAVRGESVVPGLDAVYTDDDGREIWARVAAVPFKDAEGRVTGGFVVINDVDELKRTSQALTRAHDTEERLRIQADAANRAKDEFLAMLGHELRNPLTPILAALELMRAEGKQTFAKEREIIGRQAHHLARLVDDLLDVTRIARGKVKLVPTRSDLAELVTRAVEIVSPLVEEKRHELQVDVPRGLLINVDKGRLVQVLSNLLTNAAKYTSPGGHLALRVATAKRSRAGEDVVIQVSDDGRGIDPELLPHVFDLFRQGTQDRDRAEGGLGLGLAIVKNLVELHGGSVTAFSAGAGMGSEFTIRLRRATERRKRRRAARPSRSELKSTGGGQRVLVVDDNRDIADMLAVLLRKKGYTVEVAYSGATALACARRFQPVVAMLDIGLPEMDGYELARRLKRSAATAGIKLIAVTGYGTDEVRRRVLKAGFAEHITKPIDFKHLHAALDLNATAATRRARPANRRSE